MSICSLIWNACSLNILHMFTSFYTACKQWRNVNSVLEKSVVMKGYKNQIKIKDTLLMTKLFISTFNFLVYVYALPKLK